MKKYCKQISDKFSINSLKASRQVSLSILLLTGIPSMLSFFAGHYLTDSTAHIPYIGLLGLPVMALIIGGYRILKKYPDNIVQIRNCVTEVTKGYIPHHVTLLRTNESNDLLYIEECLNTMIAEMKRKQEIRVMQEHERTMVENVSVLVKQISAPIDAIKRNLVHLDVIAPMDEEHVDISRSLKELDRIKKNLGKLMNTREMRNRNITPDASAPTAETESKSDRQNSLYIPAQGGRDLLAA